MLPFSGLLGCPIHSAVNSMHDAASDVNEDTRLLTTLPRSLHPVIRVNGHPTALCALAGGRRLLRRWICRPLQNVAAIDRRLDAVDELLQRPGVASALRAALRGPDLERCLGQVAAALEPPSAALPLDLATAAQRRRAAAAMLLSTKVGPVSSSSHACLLLATLLVLHR